MSEDTCRDYFGKPGTVTEIEANEPSSSAIDDLINQNIVKVDDYHKVKATKRVLRRVRIKPD